MQKMKIIISYAMLSVMLLANASCRSATLESPTATDCNLLISSFFLKLNPVQRQEEFGRLDISTQYPIYICGNQKVHPPTIYLAESFAKEGKKIVPFLKEKLETTKSDSTIRDIVYVCGWMQRLKTYDVASDSVLISLINRKTSEMHDAFWRAHVKKEVEIMISMSPSR